MSIFKGDRQENIIIAGCGDLGSNLAEMLSVQKENITVIDLDESCFVPLRSTSIENFVIGDATNIDVLELAGIKNADVVIVATNNNNANVMISQVAKKYYQVDTVIAVIKDLAKESLCKDVGVITISPMMLSINQLQLILASEKK